MSKAEEKAWEWASKNKLDPYSMGHAYADGYHQAEKDLELTWEDMEKVFDLCYEVLRDVYLMKFPDDKEEQKEFYQEVLKRFKDLKK